MATNSLRTDVKNQTYKPQNESTSYDRRIHKGYDLLVDAHLFQRT